MTSFSRVLCGRAALAATLWTCACERDSAALFDNERLPASATAGASGAVAGSSTSAGDGAGGDDGVGGASGDAGGKAPVAGTGATMSGGSASEGGSATAGGAGKPSAGEGGKAGSATGGGGAGGTKPDPEPEPVTIHIVDFEDTYVASCMPYVSFGKTAMLSVDYGDGCAYQALLKPSLAAIPEGALVSKATLTLSCSNDGGAIAASYVSDAWDEDTVRWHDRPDVGSAFGELMCADDGPVTLDLTAVVAAWVSGEHAAYGVYLRTEEQDGTDFASSQASNADERPSLSVTYTLPAK
jgi:hypothetical protein